MSILLLMVAAATGAAPAPAQAAEPKKERLICKAEKFVGSNVTRRICMTESQWRESREGAKDTLNDIGRGNNYRGPWDRND